MTAFAKIRLIVTSIIAFYAIYLFSYKCVQLKESPLKHAVGSVIHPLTHSHNQACEALSRGEVIVAPYVKKVSTFLDTHVHSHPLFKAYKVDQGLNFAKQQYFSFVYPLIIQLFKYVELAEVYVYGHGEVLYGKVKDLTKELF